MKTLVCPECGSKNITTSHSLKNSIFYKIKNSLNINKNRGQVILTCKDCGKQSIIFIQ